MSDLLADFARGLALHNRLQAETALARAKGRARRFRLRAEFWSDVQAWADGLGSWREIRAPRHRRRHPPVVTRLRP